MAKVQRPISRATSGWRGDGQHCHLTASRDVARPIIPEADPPVKRQRQPQPNADASVHTCTCTLTHYIHVHADVHWAAALSFRARRPLRQPKLQHKRPKWKPTPWYTSRARRGRRAKRNKDKTVGGSHELPDPAALAKIPRTVRADPHLDDDPDLGGRVLADKAANFNDHALNNLRDHKCITKTCRPLQFDAEPALKPRGRCRKNVFESSPRVPRAWPCWRTACSNMSGGRTTCLNGPCILHAPRHSEHTRA